MNNNGNCTAAISRLLSAGIGKRVLQLDALLLSNAVLMGIVVGVGVYAPRYRRHPVIGVLFVGATTLFLPIVSEVASTVGDVRLLIASLLGSLVSEVECKQVTHLVIVFIWTGIVVVIGISAVIVVAADEREGRNIDPPVMILVKAIWTAYLTASTLQLPAEPHVVTIFIQLFVIMFTKLVFKYSTFYKAKTSFAFGRSPRLIAGYMAQLQELGDVSPNTTPALVVMGEDNVQVERRPHGYCFEKMPSQQGDDTTRLVTLDKVWRLHDTGMLPSSDMIKHKNLCFSFALFKMLRCRFAKYTALEAGFMKTHRFFRNTLLQGAADDYERVFGVIEDELSFVHDYYCSSLPIYYSHHLLPFLSIALSLYSIGYCLYLILFFSYHQPVDLGYGQIVCWVPCIKKNGGNNINKKLRFGTLYSDVISMYLVLAVLVLAEIRDIVSLVCSNWTKVSLIYHHVNQACWQRSRVMKKCIGYMLKLRRCKLLNPWDDKMKQCSILELHPRKITHRRLRHFLHLQDRKKKIKVPTAVKVAIFDAIKAENLVCEQEGSLKHIRPPSSPISRTAISSKRPAYTILAWHVATSIYEVSHSDNTPHPDQSDEGHKITATHLSRYCAYLVAYCPELLPDDAKWCEKLYRDVKKHCDDRSILSDEAPAGVDQYQQLLEFLDSDSDGHHQVLKDGAKLGKQLVHSETGWEALARFWSEMILYVAPSENLEGHVEAIARGGELITLIWALLAHDGIIGRRDPDTAAATSDDARV